MNSNWMQIKEQVQGAFAHISDSSKLEAVRSHVENTIEGLNTGQLRVCEKEGDQWITHEWIKQAILMYFRLQKMQIMKAEDFTFFDKIPLKKWTGREGVRVVPQALVRTGAYVARNTVLMPSYVNIGAYVDEGTLVDTWATVGSCAQVGKNVHLSGGVGLGGVLEPLQARPVIIEDNAFIGSRSIIVEGACIRKNAVVGAGTLITSSTRIIDVTGEKEQIYRGEVPENAVVISGSTKKRFSAGEFSIPCALIIGKRSKKTDLKTSLNDCLREYDIS